VQNTCHNLTDLGNFTSGELELSQSGLEVLKSVGVIDTNLQLRWVTKVAPSLVVDGARASGLNVNCVVEAQVRLLSGTRTREKVVERVETTLSGGDRRDAASFQAVVDDLSTDQGGIDRGRAIVLKFEEKTGLGCCRGGDGFGCGQGVEDKGGIGEFRGERS
jgi:hypothetical protein